MVPGDRFWLLNANEPHGVTVSQKGFYLRFGFPKLVIFVPVDAEDGQFLAVIGGELAPKHSALECIVEHTFVIVHVLTFSVTAALGVEAGLVVASQRVSIALAPLVIGFESSPTGGGFEHGRAKRNERIVFVIGWKSEPWKAEAAWIKQGMSVVQDAKRAGLGSAGVSVRRAEGVGRVVFVVAPAAAALICAVNPFFNGNRLRNEIPVQVGGA